MEELLNKLIDKGWKPRGLLNEIEYIHAFNDVNQGWRVEISYGDHGYYKALRQIVSKESGLWQFVCENGLLEYDADILDKKVKEIGGDMRCTRYEKHYKIINTDYGTQSMFRYESPEYRLIEGALKDESELEQFLLDNIKIDEN